MSISFRSVKFTRQLTTSAVCKFNDVYEDGDLPDGTKTKKIIGVKTRFSPNSPPTIIEGKCAATVMKKFNWECKNLYGPLIGSDKKSRAKTEIIKDVPFIQHQSALPLIEELDSDLKDLNINISHNKDSVFNTLLNFPLVNKPILDENSRSLQIKDMNILRKMLETLSDSHKPSVTAILEKTMSKENAEVLRKWKERMINELGEEGFQKYQSELFAKGTALHDYINRYLTFQDDEDTVNDAIKGYIKSVKGVFPSIREIKLMEERISHPFLHYKGVVDCLATYKNHFVVIEWKTSKKIKSSLSSTFDNPLQVAAYVGALNFDPKFQYLARKGLLVIAYENGSPASLLMINEQKMSYYWKEWLSRVKLYWETVYQNKNSLN